MRRLSIPLSVQQSGEPAYHIGTVQPPTVNGKSVFVTGFEGQRKPNGEAVNIHDALDNLWAEWRKAVPTPDSDSEFVAWLVAEKGWKEVPAIDGHTFETWEDGGRKMIKAEVHSDDYKATADFDATRWFEQASDEEILELAACDWGGDYPADDVARWFEDEDSEVERVFDYVDTAGLGFECHVEVADAMDWVKANRPELAKASQAQGHTEA